MKKIVFYGFISALFLCLCSFQTMSAQIFLKEIPLKQQIEKSSLVIEGKVINKKSFWDANHHNIYTANTIEVYKVFKGDRNATVIIITPGGSIGLKAEVVTPSLKLDVGDTGVFTLHDNNIALSNTIRSNVKKFKPYSSVQGFYKYNIDTDIVVNSFSSKQGIKKSFYNEIMHHTKSDYIEISHFDVEAKQSKSAQAKSSRLVPSAFTFSPTTSTAGTESELTIMGTDFGDDKGQVYFSNADDGGATFTAALDSQVLTWSDTEIVVQIPSKAGTGKILVIDNLAEQEFSDTNLTILYSQINAVTDPDDDTANGGSNGPLGVYAFPVRHVNKDGSGGYVWKMTTQFKTIAGAEESFIRAMDTWRCETKINWTIDDVAAGASEAEQFRSVKDNINIIAFDNGTTGDPLDDLPDGVAGRCSSYYSACGSGGVDFDWFVEELDILFDDELNWQYGPSSATIGEFDFESIALHELGHGHQLGHVIQPVGAVMHYVISDKENIRSLTIDDNDAANDLQTRSESSVRSCFISLYGVNSMTSYTGSCALGLSEVELNKAITVYPNPATSQLFINNASSIKLEKVVIYDLSSRLISEYNILNDDTIKTISLDGISKGIYFVRIFSKNTVVTKKIAFK